MPKGIHQGGTVITEIKKIEEVLKMYPIIETREVQLPNGRIVVKNIVLIKQDKAVKYADGYYRINKDNVVTRRRIRL